MGGKWYERSFRRCLVDMHIPDWSPEFLAKLDPDEYARLMGESKVDAAIIYAGSCLGLCNWDAPGGRQHGSLKGKDFLGRVIGGCRERGVKVVLYFNAWSRWAYDQRPDWRLVERDGLSSVERGWRYGLCCQANPEYQDYFLGNLRDLVAKHDLDGLWIDMIGWFGSVCHCHSCKERFLRETGHEAPGTVDWDSPLWCEFQGKREEWLADFAARLRQEVTSVKPDITLALQCTSLSVGWVGGLSQRFLDAADYLAGDFPGAAVPHSVVCKLLNSLTRNKPVEYMVPYCEDLRFHTGYMTEAKLWMKALASIANGAAFVFIDAIDPDGMMREETWRTLAAVNEELGRYTPFIDNAAASKADIAVLWGMESMVDPSDNGKLTHEATRRNQPMHRIYNIAKSLIAAKLTFDVIGRRNLGSLAKYQALVLPDVIWLEPADIQAIQDYVRQGGALYASGATSLKSRGKGGGKDFQLADVLGVTFTGERTGKVSYIAPGPAVSRLFRGNSHRYPLQAGQQLRVETTGAEVLATLALPYGNGPEECDHFHSANSDPPAVWTDRPSLTLNRFGHGKALYSAGLIEDCDHGRNLEVFANLVGSLLQRPTVIAPDAPRACEFIVFGQRDRLLVNILNYQEELPPVPALGLKVKVHAGGRGMACVKRLPGQEDTPFTIDADGYVEFVVPRLEQFEMYALEFTP